MAAPIQSQASTLRIDSPRFLKLLLLIFMLNLVGAQILHEAGHWAVLQAFGRRPVWGLTSLVQLSDRSPASPADWVEITSVLGGGRAWLYLWSAPASDLEWLLFIAAGPVIQLAAVVAGFLLARYGRSPAARTIGFLVAMVNAFGGFFYQFVSLLRGVGGDEALIGYYLNVSPTVISVVLGLAFGLGLVIAMRALDTWRRRLVCGGALILGTIPIGPFFALANGVIIDQVDAGNPFFRPVIGFSLPVFLAGLLCLLLLSFAAYRWPSAQPTAS